MMHIKNTSPRTKVISILLAIMVLFTCIPSTFFASADSSANSNPLVLTNASVAFKDSSFQDIQTVESGAMFYLMITTAGNNVNQQEGVKDTYRAYLTDNNLLLPSFAGNGFVDGATYNGYTLHIEADGTRYIEFDIANGDTKVVRLQARFANGTTPDGDIAEVTLKQASSNKQVSNSIVASASANWGASKSEDKNRLSSSDVANGTTINYTLSAAPKNPSDNKGAWWVTGLQFSDTITLENMTFTDGAKASIETAVQEAIANSGYTLEDGTAISVTASGNTANIAFSLKSNNTTAEMGAVNLNVPLSLNSQTVTLGTQDGTITNALNITGKRHGEDGYGYNIGGNDVSANITAPKGPEFAVGKYVNEPEAHYLEGETVTFTISATNTGDTAGDIVLTDTVPAGLTLQEIESTDGTVSGNKVTFTNVPAGATVSATVTCQVGAVAVDRTTLTNQVDGDNGKSATASIVVRTSVTDYTVNKSGYVEYNSQNIGSNYWTATAGQKAHYTITISNTGTLPITEYDVQDIIPSAITSPEIEPAVAGLSITGNTLSGNVSLASGESISISIVGDISNTATGAISNTATVQGKTSNEVTFTPKTPAPELGITKSVDKSGYTDGGELTYTIQVSNKGTASATGVIINDNMPTGLTFSSYKIESNVNGVVQAETTLTTDFSNTIDLAAGEVVTITLKGTVNAGVTGSIANKASYTFGGDPVDSNTVTSNRDSSNDYRAEKWIVDENGNTLVDKDDNVADGFAGFSMSGGETITYRMAFYNNSASTVNELQISDYSFFSHPKTVDDVISLKVADSQKSNLTVGQDLSRPADSFSTQDNVNSHWYINLSDVGLESGGYIVFEYTTTILTATDNVAVTTSGQTSYQGWMYSGFGYNEVIFSVPNVSSSDAKVNIPWDASFGTTKSVAIPEIDTSDMSATEIADTASDFTISLSPNNSETTNYSGKTFVITDVLPDGMEYVDDSVAVSNGTLVSAVTSGNKLTITLTAGIQLSGWDASTIDITYKAKPTAETAEALFSTTEKSTKFTNTVTNIIVKDGDNTIKEKTPDSTATVTYKKVTPAPGFAKEAAASFPGKTYDDTAVSKVENGYITAGDTLIWHAAVYNGNGDTAVYTADDVATLKNYSITDTLPSSYSYDSVSGFTSTAYVFALDAEGNYPLTENGLLDASKAVRQVTLPAPNISGQKITWDCSADTCNLAPNQCLVVEFSTVANKDLEGVITNTGYATISQDFSVQDTVAGEKDNQNIHGYANYNIVGLTTESWKTITYTNQSHNGTPHTDPMTDTASGRTPTHNYVQGMQGENVSYELHIVNNSSQELENFTVIDRMPFVGDKGLVSGYDRNSAFSVALGDIQGVTVGGTTVNYTKAYSTDKTAVLDEFSEDWRGQNDVMSWSGDATNAVNFRVMLDSAVKVPVGEEVVITFTGKVPSYVENTGEGNIAWNSFAYAYQNTAILGDTVMVAEPAKVGVWVETPNTTIDVTVNKTLTSAETKDATFYFALFADEAYANRLSDIVSVTIPAGKTNASVTMEDVDLASMKQLLLDAGATNADNVYLLETDAKGDAIKAYGAAYTNNTISTDATENATVGVTNTKNVGTITVNKTMISNNTTDTFYFALFTKNGDEYVRYEDAGVKSLTLTGSETGEKGTVTFTDVPLNTTYYVLETNARGVLTSTDITHYKSEAGINYAVTATTGGVQATATGASYDITNTAIINYQIQVTKSLVSDRITTKPTFYVGLFDESKTLLELKSFSAGETVTFEGLQADTEYYVYECDATGAKVGDSFKQDVILTVNDKNPTEVEFDVAYEDCGDTPIVLTSDKTEQSVVVRNTVGDQNRITVTKTATKDNTPVAGAEIHVGLYTYNTTDNTYTLITGKTGTITTDATGKGSCVFDGLDADVTYYVFEQDKDGNPVANNSLVTVGDTTYVAGYPTGNSVKLEEGIPSSVPVTNTAETVVTLSFDKLDVNSVGFVGAQMAITKVDETTAVETWTTDGTKHEVKNLPAGDYILSEIKIDGYETLSVPFTVGADGYLVTDGGINYFIEPATMTVVNRSQMSVDKTDMGGEEVAGAEIQITLKTPNQTLSQNLITLKRGDETLTEGYTTSDTSIKFTSDGKNPTEIYGLPDGTYTMTEVTAPDGYNKVTTDLTFIITGGEIQTTYSGDEYTVTGNDLIMKDEKKPISISKADISDADTELAGAEMKLTYTGDGTLTGVTYTGGEDGSFQRAEKEITWTSGEKTLQLTGLPDGSYELVETVAPDGYTVITKFTFEVIDGKLTATGNAEVSVDNENQKLTVLDAASSVSISKKDITGQKEVAGATLELTGASTVDWDKVTLTGADKNSLTNGIAWKSGSTAVQIQNLPDGTYTLKETGEPFDVGEGADKVTYSIISSAMTFVVENGVIVSTGGAVTEYDAEATEGYYYDGGDGKTIEVCDATVAVVTTTTATTTTTPTTTTTTSTSSSDTATSTEDSTTTVPTTATTTAGTTAGTTTNSTTVTTATTTETSDGSTGTTTNSTTVTTATTTETSAGPTNTTAGTTSGTTTESSTATTATTTVTSAGPTNTTASTTSGTMTESSTATTATTTETSGDSTVTTTGTTTGTTTTTNSTTVTTATTETSAGPTNTTASTTTGTTTESGTATTVTTTESSGDSTVTTSGTTTNSGTVTTATTETSAGPTNTTASTTSGTTTETTTASATSSAATESTTVTTATTESSSATTASSDTATQTTASQTMATTTLATTEDTSETTTQATTTTVVTTSETTTSETIATTTTTEEGPLVRKCDELGNEIAGASLIISDLDGNVIDAWISEEGISHVIANAQIGVPYCLTEVAAPTDYAIAESIYFQLEADSTISILTYEMDEEGNLVRNEDGTPVLLEIAQGSENAVVMVDMYIGTGTLTTPTSTTTTTTTETTTTTAKTTEDNGEHTPTTSATTTETDATTTAMTTTTAKTTEDNGEHTPTTAATTTGTTNTTSATAETPANSNTTTVRVATSTTTTKKNTSSNSSNTSSSPKTGDALPALLIPAAVALIAAVVTGNKRKK